MTGTTRSRLAWRHTLAKRCPAVIALSANIGVDRDHFGVGGTNGHSGKLIFFHGSDPKAVVAGKTSIPRWHWQHVALVRDGTNVRAYLNSALEFESEQPAQFPAGLEQAFFGGRSDNDSNWEGRLDEVAVFNRALTAGEIAKLGLR